MARLQDGNQTVRIELVKDPVDVTDVVNKQYADGRFIRYDADVTGTTDELTALQRQNARDNIGIPEALATFTSGGNNRIISTVNVSGDTLTFSDGTAANDLDIELDTWDGSTPTGGADTARGNIGALSQTEVDTRVTTVVTTAFVDGLNVNATTLDNLDSTDFARPADLVMFTDSGGDARTVATIAVSTTNAPNDTLTFSDGSNDLVYRAAARFQDLTDRNGLTIPGDISAPIVNSDIATMEYVRAQIVGDTHKWDGTELIDMDGNIIPASDGRTTLEVYSETETDDAIDAELRNVYIADEGEILGSSFDIDNDVLTTKEYVDSLNVVNEFDENTAYPEGTIIVNPDKTSDMYRALADLDLDFDISAGTGIVVPLNLQATWSAGDQHSFPLIEREVMQFGVPVVLHNYVGDVFAGTAEGHTGIIADGSEISIEGSSRVTAADSSDDNFDCTIRINQGSANNLKIGRIAVNITVQTLPGGSFDINVGSGITGPGFGSGDFVTFSEAGQTATMFYTPNSMNNDWDTGNGTGSDLDLDFLLNPTAVEADAPNEDFVYTVNWFSVWASLEADLDNDTTVEATGEVDALTDTSSWELIQADSGGGGIVLPNNILLLDDNELAISADTGFDTPDFISIEYNDAIGTNGALILVLDATLISEPSAAANQRLVFSFNNQDDFVIGSYTGVQTRYSGGVPSTYTLSIILEPDSTEDLYIVTENGFVVVEDISVESQTVVEADLVSGTVYTRAADNIPDLFLNVGLLVTHDAHNGDRLILRVDSNGDTTAVAVPDFSEGLNMRFNNVEDANGLITSTSIDLDIPFYGNGILYLEGTVVTDGIDLFESNGEIVVSNTVAPRDNLGTVGATWKRVTNVTLFETDSDRPLDPTTTNSDNPLATISFNEDGDVMTFSDSGTGSRVFRGLPEEGVAFAILEYTQGLGTSYILGTYARQLTTDTTSLYRSLATFEADYSVVGSGILIAGVGSNQIGRVTFPEGDNRSELWPSTENVEVLSDSILDATLSYETAVTATGSEATITNTGSDLTLAANSSIVVNFRMSLPSSALIAFSLVTSDIVVSSTSVDITSNADQSVTIDLGSAAFDWDANDALTMHILSGSPNLPASIEFEIISIEFRDGSTGSLSVDGDFIPDLTDESAWQLVSSHVDVNGVRVRDVSFLDTASVHYSTIRETVTSTNDNGERIDTLVDDIIITAVQGAGPSPDQSRLDFNGAVTVIEVDSSSGTSSQTVTLQSTDNTNFPVQSSSIVVSDQNNEPIEVTIDGNEYTFDIDTTIEGSVHIAGSIVVERTSDSTQFVYAGEHNIRIAPLWYLSATQQTGNTPTALNQFASQGVVLGVNSFTVTGDVFPAGTVGVWILLPSNRNYDIKIGSLFADTTDETQTFATDYNMIKIDDFFDVNGQTLIVDIIEEV